MGGWELGEEKESSLSSYFANDLFEKKEEEKKTKRISLAYSTAAAVSFSAQSAVQNIITDTRDDDVRGTSSFFGEGDGGRNWVHIVMHSAMWSRFWILIFLFTHLKLNL